MTAGSPGGLAPALKALGLSGMLDTIDARLAEARAGTLGHAEFLQVLCEDELARRDAAKITRRIRAARFPAGATLEFDFGYNPKLPAAQIRDLARLEFIAAGQRPPLLLGYRRAARHHPGRLRRRHVPADRLRIDPQAARDLDLRPARVPVLQDLRDIDHRERPPRHLGPPSGTGRKTTFSSKDQERNPPRPIGTA